MKPTTELQEKWEQILKLHNLGMDRGLKSRIVYGHNYNWNNGNGDGDETVCESGYSRGFDYQKPDTLEHQRCANFEQAQAILKLLCGGMSKKAVARKLGTTPYNIRRTLKRFELDSTLVGAPVPAIIEEVEHEDQS